MSCPHCSREFKWRHAESNDQSLMEPDGYHCPYCNGQSVDGWWTVAQLAAIEDETQHYLETQIHDMFKGMERHSSDSLTFKAGVAPTKRNRPPLTETDDMRRVEFACHADEPVKVLENWAEPVHCLVCGQFAT
jgi:DNA-directed RNA polymerase subunit RPC12/RpoP